MIVVVMGLSGSGKSYIAKILHEEFGFEWLRSDLIRKELAGVDPYTHMKAGYKEGIYSEEWTKKVYEEMVKRAEKLASEGKHVVLDATFLHEWQRRLVRERFPQALFLLAFVEEREIVKRLKERQDVSDADLEVYLRQKEEFSAPEYAIRVYTGTDREKLRAVLRELLMRNGYTDIQGSAQ